MSTYGGDSWIPESMRRKQRVEQVLHDVHLMDRYSHQWRRLSNGRIACLVCPNRPVLDNFPMLVMHRKGEKHQAAAAKHEERDFSLQNEIQKRTALEAVKTKPEIVNKQPPTSFSACSPLLETTRKRTAQALATPDDSRIPVPYTKQKSTPFFSAAASSPVSIHPIKVEKTSASESDPGKRKKGQPKVVSKVVSKEDQEQRLERERLLRLREAGWRLDGNGKWFKDESVEFESDEETPADLL